MGMKTNTEWLDYKQNRNSAALILRYNQLIGNLASLCKGTYREPDALFRWFYGLFLDGQPRTIMNILDVRERVTTSTSHLAIDDCNHQVTVFFLEIARTFRSNNKMTHTLDFNHYIRMVLGWRTNNWIDTLIRRAETPIAPGILSLHEDYMEDEMIQPFTLNLQWVMAGSENPLFKGLSPYERYILYLYFAEGLTIVKIAHTTFQSKNTVNSDLHRIIEKCKRSSGNYNLG